MQIRIATLLGLAAALLVAGCSGGGGGEGCRRTTATASGPGDVSDHFPTTAGATWVYDTTATGAPSTSSGKVRVVVAVAGTRAVGGTTATVFTATPVDGSAAVEEALFDKGPSGVSELAGPAVQAPLDQLYPYLVLAFPLAAGSSFEQLSCSGLDYRKDLDGDGRNERVDVLSTVKVVGTESVTVAAGAFQALRVENSITMRSSQRHSPSAIVRATASAPRRRSTA